MILAHQHPARNPHGEPRHLDAGELGARSDVGELFEDPSTSDAS